MLCLPLLQHSTCFLQRIIWVAKSLPIFPRQAKHHSSSAWDAFFLFHKATPGFLCNSDLKLANENESLSNTAPASSNHDLMSCTLQNLSMYFQQSLQDGIIQVSQFLIYFIFLISRITADGDCSHEIKRHLLLGRKVMTNLDSILRSRNITLPTKVRLVQAVVFPVVMYVCENWTVKKAERRRIDAFKLWCWRRLLRIPWTARTSNQSILKEISPGCSLEGLMLKLKLQYFGHLM